MSVLDNAARVYLQSLLLAAGLRSDLLNNTMEDPNGDCMPLVARLSAPNTEHFRSSSRLTAIHYPSGVWGKPGPCLHFWHRRCCIVVSQKTMRPQEMFVLIVERWNSCHDCVAVSMRSCCRNVHASRPSRPNHKFFADTDCRCWVTQGARAACPPTLTNALSPPSLVTQTASS